MSKVNESINQLWIKNNSLLCVGLDTDPHKIPAFLNKEKDPCLKFNQAIIDATAKYVSAFKPQMAYYSAYGLEDTLFSTIEYIHLNYPNKMVILDGKRGDIGATAELYAKEAFMRYQADALTVNPYMGEDSILPYLQYEDKSVIVLCHTSNSGANDFQRLSVENQKQAEKLYRYVAKKAINEWNFNKNISLVLGATQPDAIKTIRELDDDIPFLLPGIGAQGGELRSCLQAGLNQSGHGLWVNSSRGIIYQSHQEDFAEKAALAAKTLFEEINAIRTELQQQ